MLSGKGGRVTDQYDSYYMQGTTTQYNLLYIEESVCFTGYIPFFGNGANIVVGAGPYYANPVWGKINDDYMGGGEHVKFGGNGAFKSNDYGITSLIGFQAGSGYIIGLNFDLGLLDVGQNNNNSSSFGNEHFKNRSFYLFIAQSF